jgi:DNA-binding response OmpR family regulator
MSTKNILLIEDDNDQLNRWLEELELYGYKDTTCARTIEEAIILFPQKQWDAIVVDGCIGGDDFNSPPLIKEIKAKSKAECPIIAATKNPDLAQLMIDAGCTHVARAKDHVPGMLHSILRRQQ